MRAGVLRGGLMACSCLAMGCRGTVRPESYAWEAQRLDCLRRGTLSWGEDVRER